VIVLYGATGYTGQLVTRELVDMGAELVLGGRNSEKLERVSREIGQDAPVRVASIDDPSSLRALVDGADVLINCAGPFTRAGEPVVRAAVDAGVHYIDSTGEQSFMRMVFDRYGDAAAEKGVVLIPACGFDYVPGDCIARIAAQGQEPLDELTMAYCVNDFGVTRGTMKSGIEMMKPRNAVDYRDGDWVPARTGVHRWSFEFGPPIGRVAVGPYPAGENLTVPRHTDVRNVRSVIATRSVVPPAAVPLAPYLVPLLSHALRTPLATVIDRAIDHMPEGPPEDERRAVTWTIVAQGRTRDGAPVRGSVTGEDVYGMTARALAWAGRRIEAGAHEGAGALGPAAAFDPEEMLGALSDFGVKWESLAQPSRVL
jgi:short subunit dehydrogenase-like uncharacterized protein